MRCRAELKENTVYQGVVLRISFTGIAYTFFLSPHQCSPFRASDSRSRSLPTGQCPPCSGRSNQPSTNPASLCIKSNKPNLTRPRPRTPINILHGDLLPLSYVGYSPGKHRHSLYARDTGRARRLRRQRYSAATGSERKARTGEWRKDLRLHRSHLRDYTPLQMR